MPSWLGQVPQMKPRVTSRAVIISLKSPLVRANTGNTIKWQILTILQARINDNHMFDIQNLQQLLDGCEK